MGATMKGFVLWYCWGMIDYIVLTIGGGPKWVEDLLVIQYFLEVGLPNACIILFNYHIT